MLVGLVPGATGDRGKVQPLTLLVQGTAIADGQAFDYQSIGGYETLWLLKAEAYANSLL